MAADNISSIKSYLKLWIIGHPGFAIETHFKVAAYILFLKGYGQGRVRIGNVGWFVSVHNTEKNKWVFLPHIWREHQSLRLKLTQKKALNLFVLASHSGTESRYQHYLVQGNITDVRWKPGIFKTSEHCIEPGTQVFEFIWIFLKRFYKPQGCGIFWPTKRARSNWSDS